MTDVETDMTTLEELQKARIKVLEDIVGKGYADMRLVINSSIEDFGVDLKHLVEELADKAFVPAGLCRTGSFVSENHIVINYRRFAVCGLNETDT